MRKVNEIVGEVNKKKLLYAWKFFKFDHFILYNNITTRNQCGKCLKKYPEGVYFGEKYIHSI